MPAFLAAAAATSMEAGTVKRNFASPVFRAYVISSVLYAGLAPETTPPARKVPNMATGYHTVFGEKRATVWPCLRPYFLTRAVERCVEWVLRSAYDKCSSVGGISTRQ